MPFLPPWEWLPCSRRVRKLVSISLLSVADVACYCTEFSLSEDHLRSLLGFVSDAAAKWRKIGVALGFSKGILDMIAETSGNQREPIACFTDMLSRWLKWAPPKHALPTLEKLAEALRDDTVGEERMAYGLIKNFKRKITYFAHFQACVFTSAYPTATPLNAAVSSPSPVRAQPQLSSGKFPLSRQELMSGEAAKERVTTAYTWVPKSLAS